MNIVDKLKELNITLPATSGPFGAYVPAKRAGNLIFVAGQLPRKDGQMLGVGAGAFEVLAGTGAPRGEAVCD
jgi:enamine deaminase RidA (YjgF/YER057c/UK114 family)